MGNIRQMRPWVISYLGAPAFRIEVSRTPTFPDQGTRHHFTSGQPTHRAAQSDPARTKRRPLAGGGGRQVFSEGLCTDRPVELNARTSVWLQPFNAPLDRPVTGKPERDANLTGYSVGNRIDAAASVRKVAYRTRSPRVSRFYRRAHGVSFVIYPFC